MHFRCHYRNLDIFIGISINLTPALDVLCFSIGAIMKGKLPVSHWPEELKHPEVKGVFVGGCVARGVGSRFRAKAHAHTSGEHCGWICFLSEKRLTCRMLCLHERAHIVTKEGHTKRWREYLLQIGGTLDPVEDILGDYHPRPRQPKGVPEGGKGTTGT